MSKKVLSDAEVVSEILDAIALSSLTLQQACQQHPHLAANIRQKWQQIERMNSELDQWLPVRDESNSTGDPASSLPMIPGYEGFDVIGQGGMGIVYKALQSKLGRTVAIKTTYSATAPSKIQRVRFQREAEAFASIDHPNVVKVFDVGEVNGIPYFTMEFVEGSTLEARINLGALAPREAAMLLIKLARATQSAHDRGIIHRDLKPANVLLAQDDEPKLTDFGLARLTTDSDALTQAGIALGTPRYMSPEQAMGQLEKIGTASDIYSLGAILYAALTTRPPFVASSNAELLHLVIHAEPINPSLIVRSIPRELSAICITCLQKQPKDRYASATELADDLARFLNGEATHARPDSWLSKWFRKVKRHPARSLTICLLAIFALVTCAFQVQVALERLRLSEQRRDDQLRRQTQAASLLADSTQALQAARWEESLRQSAAARAVLNSPQPEWEQQILAAEKWAKLGRELEAVRLTGFDTVGDVLDFENAHESYCKLFAAAGLGELGRDLETFVKNIQASPMAISLQGSLDHWTTCAPGEEHGKWLESAAMQIDAGTRPWRSLVKTPTVFQDQQMLQRVIAEAPTAAAAVPLLMAVELRANCSKEERLRFLKAVQRFAPTDFWINLRLASVLMFFGDATEAVGYYQTAVAIRQNVALVHNNLGAALSDCKRYDESAAELAKAIELHPQMVTIRIRLIHSLASAGRVKEALTHGELALTQNPRDAGLRSMMAVCLETDGAIEQALAMHEESHVLEPYNLERNRDFRQFCFRHGRHQRAAAVWAAALTGDYKHKDCYGLAELALFVGQDEEYERLRQELLDRFSGAQNNYEAERIARACLLKPCTPVQMAQVEKLASRVVDLDQQSAGGTYVHFQFLKALLQFRRGELEQADELLRGEAGRALVPTPSLLRSAIARARGDLAEAQELFSSAIQSYDWEQSKALDQDAWIRHAIRAEVQMANSGKSR